MANTEVSRKRGDAFDITFTYTTGGVAIDVSADTFTFAVKKKISDATEVISKADGVFDKTNAATGIVVVNITTTDSDITPGKYYAEVKKATNATSTVRSDRIDFVIREAAI